MTKKLDRATGEAPPTLAPVRDGPAGVASMKAARLIDATEEAQAVARAAQALVEAGVLDEEQQSALFRVLERLSAECNIEARAIDDAQRGLLREVSHG